MKRRLLLALAALVTAANLAVGAAYAAQCEGKGGARACGSSCVPISDGQCGCTGSCTADELKWVSGSGSKEPVAMAEELAY
jgi:hypothetical protein